jgi:hypothetical protein
LGGKLRAAEAARPVSLRLEAETINADFKLSLVNARRGEKFHRLPIFRRSSLTRGVNQGFDLMKACQREKQP